jgi:hypothetical protein
MYYALMNPGKRGFQQNRNSLLCQAVINMMMNEHGSLYIRADAQPASAFLINCPRWQCQQLCSHDSRLTIDNSCQHPAIDIPAAQWKVISAMPLHDVYSVRDPSQTRR